MINKLRLLTVMLFSVGGLFAVGGAMWALHEIGNIYFSGVIIAAVGYVLLALAVLALEVQYGD